MAPPRRLPHSSHRTTSSSSDGWSDRSWQRAVKRAVTRGWAVARWPGAAGGLELWFQSLRCSARAVTPCSSGVGRPTGARVEGRLQKSKRSIFLTACEASREASRSCGEVAGHGGSSMTRRAPPGRAKGCEARRANTQGNAPCFTRSQDRASNRRKASWFMVSSRSNRRGEHDGSGVAGHAVSELGLTLEFEPRRRTREVEPPAVAPPRDRGRQRSSRRGQAPPAEGRGGSAANEARHHAQRAAPDVLDRSCHGEKP